MKNQLWEEVAQAFNGKFSTAVLKLKFKSLHDTFRKIIQAEHHASGSGRQVYGKKWSHYDSMQFLRDSCLLKNTVSNVQTAEKEQIPSTSASINDENNDTRSIQSGSVGRRKRARDAESTDAIDRIADAICQSANIELPPPPVSDEIDSFLSLLGFRLRRMSSGMQLNVMQEILELTYKLLNTTE